jgi:hypothetical protein
MPKKSRSTARKGKSAMDAGEKIDAAADPKAKVSSDSERSPEFHGLTVDFQTLLAMVRELGGSPKDLDLIRGIDESDDDGDHGEGKEEGEAVELESADAELPVRGRRKAISLGEFNPGVG